MFSMKACVNCQNNTRKRTLLIVMATMFLSMVLMGAMYDSQRKRVTLRVYDDFSGVDMVKKLDTRQATVRNLMNELGIEIGEHDITSPALDEKIGEDGRVVIRRGSAFTLVCDGNIVTAATTKKKVVDALAEVGVEVGPDDEVVPALEESIGDDKTVTIARISYEQRKQEAEIPYTEVKIEDANLFEGETELRQAGSVGKKEITYKVTFRDGNEIATEQVEEKTIVEPTEKVVAVGTKKKNGTYKGFTYKKKITVNASAYEPYNCGGDGRGITASGIKAQYGVVAVDPKVIPLGTKLYIESTDDGKSWSYGYCIAADTGGAIKGNRIDLCYNTVGECIKFGRRSANVYVLE